MAKLASKQRVKTVIAVPLPRPRNPFATAARQRAAGVHGSTRKADRVAARVKLKKGLDES